eukprot:CAMPEP_0113233294 /NCGR_PEP_ID=MMETSP0008_2-20120614/2404_1 /TAXON_ID=97485 /ORGANISM="Prymnesium parvum" /LENGTH=70 /DNA_ID=CAMNT_0000080061 /DNA_START=795 /DNA_END=1007 /DNA_ORIENTATION=+ /assembly_acc=CAM_ASM_000153
MVETHGARRSGRPRDVRLVLDGESVEDHRQRHVHGVGGDDCGAPEVQQLRIGWRRIGGAYVEAHPPITAW